MSTASDVEKPPVSASTGNSDAVVVGAGPYGLSVAAHLLGHGLDTVICGKPLGLWREHMPRGMWLRSPWWASNLSDPQRWYEMGRYLHEIGHPVSDPLPIETFVDYGLWFQRHAVPQVNETYVAHIERTANQFTVLLADGRTVETDVVVMAPGLQYYAYRAAAYDQLPGELVSHTADHQTFDGFARKLVVVVGGGQSAVETAALLSESGAQVHLVSRRPIHWLAEPLPSHRPLLERVRTPQAGIGPGWLPWGLEHVPYAFQRLPLFMKTRLLRLAGPAAAPWLRQRVLGKVVQHEAQQVQEVQESTGRLSVVLANRDVITADHLILATGYHVDVSKLPMLSPALRAQVRTYQGAPILSDWFESSVPGLYFVGISSLSSCGPLFRFVVGTTATARRVATVVARRAGSGRR